MTNLEEGNRFTVLMAPFHVLTHACLIYNTTTLLFFHYRILFLHITYVAFFYRIMARLPLSTRTRRRNLTLMMSSVIFMYYYIWVIFVLAYKEKWWKIERRIKIRELRSERLYQLIRESDISCISELRVDRRTFDVLCEMLRDVASLKSIRNMPLEEMVAAFLYMLSHHLKNRTTGQFFF